MKDLDINVDIIKKVNVLEHNNQFSVKIPKELVDYFKLKKGDQIEFKVEIPEDGEKKETCTFKILKKKA